MSTTQTSKGRSEAVEMIIMGNIMALVLTMIIMVIPGIIANSLAMYCIIPDLKKRKTLVKQLLLLLSVTDVLGIIGTIVLQLVNIALDITPYLCSLASFLTLYFPMLSGAVATFMTMERCLALRAPYWYQEHMFSWKIWAPFLTATFVITIVCLMPEMSLGELFFNNTIGNETIILCGSFPDGQAANIQESIFPASYGILGLILVIINVSCSITVLVTVRAMKNQVHPSVTPSGNPSLEFMMTKLVLVLCATYLICWLPVNVDLILHQLGVEKSEISSMITHSLVGFNFVFDPIIYIVMMRNYRQKVKRLCCCKKITEDASNVHNSQQSQQTSTQLTNLQEDI